MEINRRIKSTRVLKIKKMIINRQSISIWVGRVSEEIGRMGINRHIIATQVLKVSKKMEETGINRQSISK